MTEIQRIVCSTEMRGGNAFLRTRAGRKLELMTHKDSPMGPHASPENANRIMQAALTVDGGRLMTSDEMAGADYKGMSGFGVSLTYKTAEEGEARIRCTRRGSTDHDAVPEDVLVGRIRHARRSIRRSVDSQHGEQVGTSVMSTSTSDYAAPGGRARARGLADVRLR